ncbi:MAG TPA: pectinesterase family protein [Fibrobacteraceae bacterium]|nr:pectinesterase family protein [Fibrobacteraceae bacterium]
MYRLPIAIFVPILFLAIEASAITATGFFPENGATGICLDVPLRITFSSRPTMGWYGSIRIRNAATNTVVKTWDVSSNPGDPNSTSVSASWPWQDSVGSTYRNVWAIVLDSVPENLAEIRIPRHLLAANTQYQIELDSGAIKGTDGTVFSGVASGVWTFTTGAAPSSQNSIVVASDNTGDVCTIERGLELVPSNSSSTVQVLVRPGYYREVISAKNKRNLQLYGAGTEKTFIRYLNCNNLNSGTSTRSVLNLGGNNMSIRALSLTNTVDVAGTQAEALYLQGDSNIVADVFFHSFQDTWLNNSGTAYVQDATLEGSVDFIWGYYPVFFKRCTLVLNRTNGVIVQPRNSSSSHGYVFDSCTVQAATTGYSNCHFARDAGSSYSYGEVMFLHTKIYDDSFFATAPWTINSGTDSTHLRFCEYLSMDSAGKTLTISGTQRKNMQCSSDSASAHASPYFVLGWTPSVPSLSSVLALTNSSVATSSSSLVSSSSANVSSSSTAVALVKHGTGSSTQTVQVNTEIVEFYFSWTGATSVDLTGVPTGISATIDEDAQTVTFSGAPTDTGTYAYTVTTVGADSEVSKSGTFTVVDTLTTEIFQAQTPRQKLVFFSTHNGFVLQGLSGNEQIWIIDILGHGIQSLSAISGLTTWSAPSSLSRGLYLVRVREKTQLYTWIFPLAK